MTLLAIYDLEIEKAIPPANPNDRLPGIKYCEGWKDFKGMNVSCWALTFVDPVTHKISAPDWGTDLETLIEALNEQEHMLGGFNSFNFDDLLCEAMGYQIRSDFDILQMVLEAAGMQHVEYWKMEPKRSYSLKAIAQANGYRKTLSGEEAPIEWQRGNKYRVIEYCRNDVIIEAKTLIRLRENRLIDPNTGQVLRYEPVG